MSPNAKLAAERLSDLLQRPIDGYRPIKYLGEGKTSAVYEAQDARGERVALKVVFQQFAHGEEGDIQEARIERCLDLRANRHPNLVQIRDGGRCASSRQLFLSMDLVEGETLDNLRSSVDEALVAPIVAGIASAAWHLEVLGHVHRDIKPGNVIIERGSNRPVLLDLGIVRPIGDSDLTDTTNHKEFIGTRRYAPPEFVKRVEQDSIPTWRAVTFYQLGAILFELSSRRMIFEGIDVKEELEIAIAAGKIDFSTMRHRGHVYKVAKSSLSIDPTARLFLSWSDFCQTLHAAPADLGLDAPLAALLDAFEQPLRSGLLKQSKTRPIRISRVPPQSDYKAAVRLTVASDPLAKIGKVLEVSVVLSDLSETGGLFGVASARTLESGAAPGVNLGSMSVRGTGPEAAEATVAWISELTDGLLIAPDGRRD